MRFLTVLALLCVSALAQWPIPVQLPPHELYSAHRLQFITALGSGFPVGDVHVPDVITIILVMSFIRQNSIHFATIEIYLYRFRKQ